MQKTQPQSKPRNSTQCRHLSVLPVWQISATISERRSRNVNIRRNSLARTNALKTERERTRERAEGRGTEGSRQGERLERGEAEKRLSISPAFHPICRRSPEGVGRRSKEREGGMQSGGSSPTWACAISARMSSSPDQARACAKDSHELDLI